MKEEYMNKKVLSLIVFLLLAAVLVACADAPEESAASAYPADMVAKGETLYAQTCFACHGPDATGIENLGKDLTSSDFFNDSTDAELVAYVKEGRAVDDPLNTTGIAMPPKGGFDFLTDDDIQAVIAYLRGLVK